MQIEELPKTIVNDAPEGDFLSDAKKWVWRSESQALRDLGYKDEYLPTSRRRNRLDRDNEFDREKIHHIIGSVLDYDDQRRVALRLVIEDLKRDKEKRYHLPAYADPISRQSLPSCPDGFTIDKLIRYHKFQADRVTNRRYSVTAEYDNDGDRLEEIGRKPIRQGYFLDPRVIAFDIITPAMIESKLELLQNGYVAPETTRPASNGVIHYHQHHEELIMPAPTTATAVNPETSENLYGDYEAYKQSFGFQIKMHRNHRGLTLEQVADAVSRVVSEGISVKVQDVRNWEKARTLPNQDQFEALAEVLLDTIAGDKRETAYQELKTAYERSKPWINRTDAEAREHLEEIDAFTDLLRTYTDKMNLSADRLALLVQAKLRFEMDAQEKQYLEEDRGAFIAGIEAGKVHPSKNLMLALVSALDNCSSLGEYGKQALYAAYENC